MVIHVSYKLPSAANPYSLLNAKANKAVLAVTAPVGSRVRVNSKHTAVVNTAVASKLRAGTSALAPHCALTP